MDRQYKVFMVTLYNEDVLYNKIYPK